MRPLLWIVGVPLLLVGAFFAVANRQSVAIDLWPFLGKLELPLFAALVGALYLGFLLGAAVAWWAGRAGRGRGREARRRAARLEEENRRLQARLDAGAPPGAENPPATLPALPPGA
jgi:uncharacterized integral membrane protein